MNKVNRIKLHRVFRQRYTEMMALRRKAGKLLRALNTATENGLYWSQFEANQGGVCLGSHNPSVRCGE